MSVSFSLSCNLSVAKNFHIIETVNSKFLIKKNGAKRTLQRMNS